VTLYLGPAMNARLVPQLGAMKAGSRVVSHGSPIPDVEPAKVERVTSAEDGISRPLYLYTTPLKKARQNASSLNRRQDAGHWDRDLVLESRRGAGAPAPLRD
jgi:hypothetical protein